MKKHLRQIICVLLVACLATGFTPSAVQAATIKGNCRIYTVKENKWYTEKGSEKYNDYYKIKVSSVGYIKLDVDTSKCNIHHNPARLSIETGYGDNGAILNRIYNGRSYIVLQKGTYYLSASHTNLRFRYDFVKKSRSHNYCKAKADTLKAGVTKTRFFDYGYEFEQWFKVKLDGSRAIKIALTSGDGWGDFELKAYSSDAREIDLKDVGEDGSDTSIYETEKLSKGTYYITVSRPKTMDSRSSRTGKLKYKGRVFTLKWTKK